MSYTQKKKFCTWDVPVHLSQSSFVCFLEHSCLLPLLEASSAVDFWASPFLLAFFFLCSSFLSCFLQILLPLLTVKLMFSLGSHPGSSSVDNHIFAQLQLPFIHVHYCPVNTPLVGTSLPGPVILASSWISSFGCLLHSYNSVHQKNEKSCFASEFLFSWSFCFRAYESLHFL